MTVPTPDVVESFLKMGAAGGLMFILYRFGMVIVTAIAAGLKGALDRVGSNPQSAASTAANAVNLSGHIAELETVREESRNGREAQRGEMNQLRDNVSDKLEKQREMIHGVQTALAKLETEVGARFRAFEQQMSEMLDNIKQLTKDVRALAHKS